MSSAAVLSSWKEIAQFMGKGVRTVQRWENVNGLPVHRPPNMKHRGVVLAFPEELNVWMRGNEDISNSAHTERLRSQIDKLRKEKKSLIQQLELARTEIRDLRSCISN